jgi:hypothetical protein
MYMVASSVSVVGVYCLMLIVEHTGAGSGQSGIVGVEHDLGARALFNARQHVAPVLVSHMRGNQVLQISCFFRARLHLPTFCHCLRPSWFWWSLCHAGTLFLRWRPGKLGMLHGVLAVVFESFEVTAVVAG